MGLLVLVSLSKLMVNKQEVETQHTLRCNNDDEK